MFFFIGGIQPKTRIVDNVARRCPNCGLHQAFLQQVDHYLSIFFIPLVRVRKGTPFLYCQRCQQAVGNGANHRPMAPQTSAAIQCNRCGRRLDREFSYCPFCGQKQ